MNINNVYEAEIWRVIERKNPDKFNRVDFVISFEKKALVYKNDFDRYFDLSTKKYYEFDKTFAFTGQLFIKPETMVPVSTIIESKRNHMTKRKIKKEVKKVKESSNEESI